MVLVNANFNKTKCADCSIRISIFFNLSDNMKQTFGRDYLTLCHSILLPFMFIIAVVTN